ncbi:hypothetical protein EDC56_3715 [Sinobacterium caligoides]|uniref:Uncharacterized protein n=1 Tax=Sinobacterium caligoides TaxID=933926 RepID=A0A3N2D5E0_9GAMM|nr:hypothetical protein [Sinobacterium caligoides]ROR94902.1 hypothetical protein EDC56_3715 [Sinobacterium caligoides]
MRDRKNPQFFEAINNDPHLSLSSYDRQLYEKDMSRRSVRILLPLVRLVMIVSIALLRMVKRLLPFTIKSHGLLNRLGVWFMANFISKEALEYIIRHFQLESALINFVASNCQSDAVIPVTLMPTHVSQLGDVDGMNAIVLHDINIYNHVIDTGASADVRVDQQLPLEAIDFSALTIPAIDVEPHRRRLLNLDIETASYIMIFFLVLFLSDEEAERAALSLQLDESLMASLSKLTGNPSFQRLSAYPFMHHIRYQTDVVNDLRHHMMSIDYAYHQCLAMKPSP